MNEQSKTASADSSPPAWVPRFASFLRSSQEAQAVIWDDEETELSVATIGEVDETTLRRTLEATLSAATAAHDPSSDPAAFDDLRLRRLPAQHLLEKKDYDEQKTRTWAWRKIPWPSAAEAAGLDEEEDSEWRFLAVLASLCAILGLAGLTVHHLGVGPAWLSPALYILAMIAGGWDAAKDAGPNLLKGKLDIHFLMLAVAIGASFIGAYGEGALLLFLFSFAGALEHFALYRTRKEIHSLFRVAPKTATLLDPDTQEERLVPVEDIVSDDVLRVRPGDVFPVDGIVEDGDTAADESSITGEANPVGKGLGDEVYSGTHNLWGAVEIRCKHPASQSSLQKIIHLIQQARHMRAPSQRFTDKFGPTYTIGVLIATTLMFFVWWLVLGVPPFLNTDAGYSAFYRAMTLLVVASPCALVLSIPSAILAAIAWGARHGILFRGGAAIEGLAAVKAVGLDKTGTLTTGDLHVTAVESFPPGRERDVAEMAYTLEQRASHPIARAIVAYGEAEDLQVRPIDAFRSLTGKGVQAQVGSEECLLGRRELLMEGPLAEWVETLPTPEAGLTEVWFVHGELLGRILLQDQIREESATALQQLQKAGLHVAMLTGDRAEAAQTVGEHLSLSEIRAGLSPEDKVDALQDLRSKWQRVAMVGDGINDAPVLAAADIAVAMGARGSDAALEQSDVVLMNDQIENFYEAYRLSQRSRRIIRQNIAVSLGTIVIMVGTAFLGIVPITIGVLAHEGSTVAVCLNSMRLLRGKRVTK